MACLAVFYFFKMDAVSEHLVMFALKSQLTEGIDRLSQFLMTVKISVAFIAAL